MLDVEKIRKEFPILSRKVYGHDLIYFDNAATAQVPKSVIDAITRTYTKHHANVHRGVHCLSQEATDEQEQTRREVASWIGAADPAEVIFTRGTTEGINLVASCLTQGMEAGDDIVLTVMEHHSNIVPWQLAAGRRGLIIKVVRKMRPLRSAMPKCLFISADQAAARASLRRSRQAWMVFFTRVAKPAALSRIFQKAVPVAFFLIALFLGQHAAQVQNDNAVQQAFSVFHDITLFQKYFSYENLCSRGMCCKDNKQEICQLSGR